MNACPHPELRRITEDEAAALPVRMTHICVHCDYPVRETIAPDVFETVAGITLSGPELTVHANPEFDAFLVAKYGSPLISLIPLWDTVATELRFDPDSLSREPLPLPSFEVE